MRLLPASLPTEAMLLREKAQGLENRRKSAASDDHNEGTAERLRLLRRLTERARWTNDDHRTPKGGTPKAMNAGRQNLQADEAYHWCSAPAGKQARYRPRPPALAKAPDRVSETACVGGLLLFAVIMLRHVWSRTGTKRRFR